MATRWVVRPKVLGQKESVEGANQFGEGWGEGSQVVVAADTMAEALRKGEVRLGRSADQLEATIVG